MENHHCSWELFLWPFSIAMLVYQRVSMMCVSYIYIYTLARSVYEFTYRLVASYSKAYVCVSIKSPESVAGNTGKALYD